VISDFVSGAAEKLVLANQQHEVIVVEGQGSLFHHAIRVSRWDAARPDA